MGLLIFYLVLSIFFSFLCSILEAVLLSVTPTFLNVALSEKKGYATTLKKLKDDVDKPLIAILTLNTVAHTVGAIGVGAQAETVFEGSLSILGFEIPMIGIISSVMTILILVVSEIIPKTIGASYWKSLASFSTFTLNLMVNVLKYTGIMWILQLFTKMIGKSGGHGHSVLSRTDFSVMAEMGAEQGVFKESENTIIQNLLLFKTVTADQIDTPRTVVVASDENITVKDFFDQNPNLAFSRIPVYNDNIDNLTGYVMKDRIWQEVANDNDKVLLKDIKREILSVGSKMPVPDIFNQLVRKKEHIAQVQDEFGGTAGVVTMEDVIETLLGMEIMDETDTVEDMQVFAKSQKKLNERG